MRKVTKGPWLKEVVKNSNLHDIFFFWSGVKSTEMVAMAE